MTSEQHAVSNHESFAGTENAKHGPPISSPRLSGFVDSSLPQETSGTMSTLSLTKLSLISYAGLCTAISMCLGFMVSVLLALAVFGLGLEFSITLGFLYIDSHVLGIVSIFVGPFVGGALGLFGSFLTYPLFQFILRWSSGMTLTGHWKAPE